MKRILFFCYGVICHLLFLLTYGCMAGFVGNLFVPWSVDYGSIWSLPSGMALPVNSGLVMLFSIQHSVMARPAFKRWWTQYIAAPIERSTYVLVSCLVTWVLMLSWQPMNLLVWDVVSPNWRAVLWILFAAGWLMVPLVSLMINHFDLFGTRQVWMYLKGQPYQSLPFRVPMLYRYVRHPLYLGWALAFWATPTMTAGHLLFAGSLTVYMVLAACIEERDLIAHFGARYLAYRRQVPMFVPALRVERFTENEPR